MNGIEKEKKRIIQISDILYEAAQSLHVLSNISWDNEIRESFFEKGAKELPIVSYPLFNSKNSCMFLEK